MIRFDLREVSSAEKLSLPANAVTTVGPFESLPSTLQIMGNGSGVSTDVSSVRIVTEAGAVTQIRSTVSSVSGFGEVSARLAVTSAFGIGDAAISSFLDAAREHDRDGAHYSRTLGPGLALGVPVTVRVACASASECSITYTASPLAAKG